MVARTAASARRMTGSARSSESESMSVLISGRSPSRMSRLMFINIIDIVRFLNAAGRGTLAEID